MCSLILQMRKVKQRITQYNKHMRGWGGGEGLSNALTGNYVDEDDMGRSGKLLAQRSRHLISCGKTRWALWVLAALTSSRFPLLCRRIDFLQLETCLVEDYFSCSLISFKNSHMSRLIWPILLSLRYQVSCCITLCASQLPL